MKSDTRTIVLVVAAAVAIAAVTWVVSSKRSGSPLWSSGDDARISELERKQDEQFRLLSEKLDRMASNGSDRGPPGASARASRAPGGIANPQNLAQMAQRTAQMRRDLDARVQGEPVAAQWALETTRQIEGSLTAQSLQEIGAAPPEATDVQCRTTICKISMVFGDETDAADAAVVMNMAMADRLPHTQVFQKPRADGRIDYVVYASKTRSK